MGKGGGYTQWSERAGGEEGGEAGGGVECGTMGSMGDGLEVETARTGGRRVGRPGETAACGRLGVGARGGWGSLVCRESAATVPCGATRDGVGTRATWKLSPTPQGALATSRCVPATRYNSHSHVALHHPPCDPPLAPPPPTTTPPPSSPLYAPPPRHADGAPTTYLPPPPSLPGAPSSVAAALAAPSPQRQRRQRRQHRPFARLPPPLLCSGASFPCPRLSLFSRRFPFGTFHGRCLRASALGGLWGRLAAVSPLLRRPPLTP